MNCPFVGTSQNSLEELTADNCREYLKAPSKEEDLWEDCDDQFSEEATENVKKLLFLLYILRGTLNINCKFCFSTMNAATVVELNRS